MIDLEKISVQLKSEFIAIDYVIDRIIDSIKVWVKTDKINSPTVICMWGMTGCGKTKLIMRLVELLGLKDDTFYLNMTNQSTAQDSLKEIMDGDCYYNGNPKNVFVLDEFQNCNTKKEDGSSIDRKELAIVWELLDSGKFSNKRFPISTWSVGNLIKDFETVDDYNLYGKTMDEIKSLSQSKKRGPRFLEGDGDGGDDDDDGDDDVLGAVLGAAKKGSTPKKLSLLYIDEFTNYFHAKRDSGHPVNYKDYEILSTTFGSILVDDLVKFYRDIINKYVLVEYDYSKSLIFVLGNLDYLYTIADEMDSDVDADFLHERSLALTFQDTKKVLIDMYRPEQISRLGNNHILYYAFSQKNYKDLIRYYLKDINKRFEVNFKYDNSVLDMIYKEGVFPTQGVRPLLSTLKYTIENNVFEIMEKGSVNSLIRYSRNSLIIDEREKIKITLINTFDRLDKKSDEYKRICVHESAHAFVYYKLYKKFPKNIVVKRNSELASGFTELSLPVLSTSLDIKNNVCVLLAGMVSEKIVYGNHANGGESDIKKATNLINQYHQYFAMGDKITRTKFSDATNEFIDSRSCFDDTEKILKQCRDVSDKIIRDNIEEFKKLVKNFYKKGRMTEKAFARLFPEYEIEKSKRFEEFLI